MPTSPGYSAAIPVLGEGAATEFETVTIDAADVRLFPTASRATAVMV
jgi:hypothetical protein